MVTAWEVYQVWVPSTSAPFCNFLQEVKTKNLEQFQYPKSQQETSRAVYATRVDNSKSNKLLFQ